MKFTPILEIQKQIPIPNTNAQKVEELMRKLEIGDSFLVPFSWFSESELHHIARVVGIEIEIREETEYRTTLTLHRQISWRIWRVK